MILPDNYIPLKLNDFTKIILNQIQKNNKFH